MRYANRRILYSLTNASVRTLFNRLSRAVRRQSPSGRRSTSSPALSTSSASPSTRYSRPARCSRGRNRATKKRRRKMRQRRSTARHRRSTRSGRTARRRTMPPAGCIRPASRWFSVRSTWRTPTVRRWSRNSDGEPSDGQAGISCTRCPAAQKRHLSVERHISSARLHLGLTRSQGRSWPGCTLGSGPPATPKVTCRCSQLRR